MKSSGKQLYFPNMHHLLPLIFCTLSIPISSFALFASATDDQISLSCTKLCRLPCTSLLPLGGNKTQNTSNFLQLYFSTLRGVSQGSYPTMIEKLHNKSIVSNSTVLNFARQKPTQVLLSNVCA